jgi:hypothetical protein
VLAGLITVTISAVLQPRHVPGQHIPRDRLVVAALLASFCLPPLALWLVAQLVPTFVDRYVICSTVAVIGLAAVGLDVVRKRAGHALAWTLVVVLAFVGVQRIVALEREPLKGENPPAVVAFLRTEARPGDAIGFGGGGLRTVSPATLASRLVGIDRLWLVTDPSDRRYPTYGPFSALRADVSQSFEHAADKTFPGMDVTLYVRRPPPPAGRSA